MVDSAKDYEDNPMVVGDFARSIESGWLGRIEEFTVEEVDVDAGWSYTEVMCKMTGVCELSMMACGLTAEQAISSDDVQWFAAKDLRRVK